MTLITQFPHQIKSRRDTTKVQLNAYGVRAPVFREWLIDGHFHLMASGVNVSLGDYADSVAAFLAAIRVDSPECARALIGTLKKATFRAP